MTTDEARWADAERELRSSDPALDPRLRRRTRRAWLIAVVLGLVGALSSALLHAHRHTPHLGGVPWQALAEGFCGTAGVALCVGALVIGTRTGFGDLSSVLYSTLTRQQRRSLMRQVRGQVPADPDRLPLARLAARHLIQQVTGQQIGTAAIVLVLIGVSVEDYPVGLAVGGGSLLLLSAVRFRDVPWAAAFLATHPVPEDTA